jgi:phenylpyruvate tautomerase PptA (4-oxalocrotonate tautomerase family)
MPFLNIHVVRGRSEEETQTLLQGIHDALVEAFGAPLRDRYQILNEHEAGRFIVQDSGLGFERSDRRVLIHMTTRPRTRAEKEQFYALVTRNLADRCGMAPEDIVIALVENKDEDWSFGFGRAQFMTGELF